MPFRFRPLYSTAFVLGAAALCGWLASAAPARANQSDDMLAAAAASIATPTGSGTGTVVEFTFTLSGTEAFLGGTQTVDVMLDDADAPITVANFLSYVNSGAYNNSFIHRSVPGFIIQGGGYGFTSSTTIGAIPAGSAIQNEFSASRSNLRGTIAMAKVSGDPNSATNQWFFNLADNSANLDTQNGGFTVFGQVIGSGMQVVDAIAGAPVYDASAAIGSAVFTNLPLIDYSGTLVRSNFVNISSVQVVSTPLPEPSSLVFMGIGLAGIALLRKRK